MSWDDDEFERELIMYSEIETVPEETLEVIVPETIQRYQQRIQSNNTASIFDADYSLPITNGDLPSENFQNSNSKEQPDDILFKDDEKIIRCVSGRGRGGRNLFHKPGDQSKVTVSNDDEDVIQQLRKVAPIGYSNEITEIAVRAHHKAKQIEKEINTQSSPSISKSSSPSTVLESKLCSLKEFKTPISITSSGTSSPSNRSSDFRSSYYFTPHDEINSNGSQLGERISFEESESELVVLKTDENSEIANGEAHSSPVESSKPIPLSEMLRLSREQHRQRQIERRKNPVQNNEVDLASQRKIEEILQQDRIDGKLKRETERFSSPSVSSTSSREEILPWRQRTNSPPKYAWGKHSKWKRREELDISSTLDFPPLKRGGDDVDVYYIYTQYKAFQKQTTVRRKAHYATGFYV